jgi:hypothetical protein
MQLLYMPPHPTTVLVTITTSPTQHSQIFTFFKLFASSHVDHHDGIRHYHYIFIFCISISYSLLYYILYVIDDTTEFYV